MAKRSRQSASSARKLRVAFIGAGGIAGTQMNALKAMKDVELVALADVSQQTMQRHAEAHGIAEDHCFTEWQKMLEQVRPDAVSVCTPNGLHAPASIDALNAGAHVIVEKPMAMNAEEGQAMVDAAKKKRRKLCVGFQYRFSPKTRFLTEAREAGRFGDILYAKVKAIRRRGIPSWGVFGRKDLQGGGPMIDIGVHMLEVAHFSMGSPKPVAASGMTWTYLGNRKSNVQSTWGAWDHKTYTVEDLAVGQIRFDNGSVLSIESSFAAHTADEGMDFSIMGTKGGANWGKPEIYRDDAGHMINSQPAFLPKGGFPEMFDAKLRDFVDHVLYDKPSIISGEHGLMVQKMLDGIYASAEQGREVAID